MNKKKSPIKIIGTSHKTIELDRMSKHIPGNSHQEQRHFRQHCTSLIHEETSLSLQLHPNCKLQNSKAIQLSVSNQAAGPSNNIQNQIEGQWYSHFPNTTKTMNIMKNKKGK